MESWVSNNQTLRMQMAIPIVNQTTAMEIQFRRKKHLEMDDFP